MTDPSANTGLQAGQQDFERILSCDLFKGLKAVLDTLSPDRDALWAGVNGTSSYEELVARLGYRITLTGQIHVRDAYCRVGSAGGIKAVLPYHDIPTQSSLPTLVHFDSSLTTTPNSARFFNKMLAALKAQLSAQK